MRLFVILAIAITAVSATRTNYEGYKVYQIYPKTEEEMNLIQTFESDSRFDFWSDLRGIGFATDVMLGTETQKEFENILKSQNVFYNIKIDDVQKTIDEERFKMDEQSKIPLSSKISFTTYHRHGVINDYLKGLAKNFSNIVSLETVGKSYEGREMLAVKISSGGSKNKSAIIIDGGIHAREWIAPATVLYIIDQLVSNQTNSYLYKNVDWYILPVLNPDGYEFSHTTTRLWRKTRMPGTQCIGTDANRNFDFKWGTIGSSTNECSETYRGPSAFSEIEARSIANFAKKYANNTKLYLSFHSYGQLLLYPWGYTNQAAENGRELQTVGDAVKDAIASVNGTVYKVGYSYITIYPTSGSSVDYVRGALDIPLSYTLELPDRGYGFVLPPSYIHGVVVETFEGVRVFGKYVEEAYGPKSY